MTVEDNKRLVARAVADVINAGDLDAVDRLYAPGIAEAARAWVAPFRAAFPDVRMETVALVGEGDTVVGHFRCSGTQTGPWHGRPAGRPPAGRSVTCARSTGSPSGTAASSSGGGWRTTTTGAASCGRPAPAGRVGDERRVLSGAGCVHDHRHADQADERAHHVVAIRPEPVDRHAPGQ